MIEILCCGIRTDIIHLSIVEAEKKGLQVFIDVSPGPSSTLRSWTVKNSSGGVEKQADGSSSWYSLEKSLSQIVS